MCGTVTKAMPTLEGVANQMNYAFDAEPATGCFTSDGVTVRYVLDGREVSREEFLKRPKPHAWETVDQIRFMDGTASPPVPCPLITREACKHPDESLCKIQNGDGLKCICADCGFAWSSQ